MKSKLLVTLLTVTLVIASLTGCGASSNNVPESTETVTEAPTTTPEEIIETEPPHEHAYAEEVTTPATCLEDGEATFTCECGDTYTEAIPATGHDFSNYVSNEDATYTADGTETATCTCGETDTRIAEGSMLTYTFEDMDATKYAKSTVNVRSLPNTDGEKLGGLSTNDEVKVTGKCTETGWYRIEYSDSIAYVSDEYLVDEKVEVQASAPAASRNLPTLSSYAEVKALAISLGYPIGGATDNGDGTAATYHIKVVSNDDYLSWDYEYEARLADLESSRRAADVIAADKSPHLEKCVKEIKIAICPDSNYAWYVSIGRQ